MKEKQSGNEILDLENDFEKEVLKKKIKSLEKKLFSLEQLLRDEGIESDEIPQMSDEVYIAVTQLRKMRDMADGAVFDKDEVKVLETLQKVLKTAKADGKSNSPKRKTKAKKGDLIKIAQSKE